jgi:hypothetical protein
MPTILELFKKSTLDTAVKADTETFREQESSGIRVKSAVDLNNPLIYGNQTLRIATRSTTTLDRMKMNRTADAGSSAALQITRGLIGVGLTAATAGVVDTASSGRDMLENIGTEFLGMPTRQIPSSVYNRIILQDTFGEYDTSKPIQAVGTSTEIGKLLTSIGGGSPDTIKRQAIGKGIGFAKDKVREKLFGIPANLEPGDGNEQGFTQLYSNKNKKSNNTPNSLETYRGISNDGDTINLLTTNDSYTIDDNGKITYGSTIVKDLIPFYIGHIKNRPTLFRANILGLSENVSPSWSTHKFLGNPFNFYTYSGVERSVQFNLQIYAGSKAELATNWEKISQLTAMTYPTINSNRLVDPPIIKFRLGDIYKDKYGYIESLSYEIPDNGIWETEEDGHALPRFITASITIKFIEDVSVLNGIYGYKKSSQAVDAANTQLQQNAVNTNPVTNTGASQGGALSDLNVASFSQQAVGSSNVSTTTTTATVQSTITSQDITRRGGGINFGNDYGGKVNTLKQTSLISGLGKTDISSAVNQSSITNKLGSGTIFSGLKKTTL